MTEYCVYCKKTHEAFCWKNTDDGWFCEEWFTPTTHEWVPQRVIEERKQFAGDLVQPFRNGELSQEYVQRYGTKSINVTKEEAKKAKRVWKDIKGL